MYVFTSAERMSTEMVYEVREIHVMIGMVQQLK